MKLIDVFQQLRYGELGQLAIGGKGTGGIQPSDYENLITHINLGLLELYKRFDIRYQEVVIQEYASINLYYLNSDYAVSNTGSSQPIKYVLDTVEAPFLDNILRIQKVTQIVNNAADIPLFINDSNQCSTITTPQYNTVCVPEPDDVTMLTVQYRAAPDVIPGDADPATQEVSIPLSLVEALLLYVASRIYATKPHLDQDNKGAEYLAKFEIAVRRVRELNLVQTNNTTNLKLDTRGWV